MIGLIKKDWLMIKSNLLTFIIMIGIVTYLAFTGSNMFFMIPFMGFILYFSTFSYDEYNKWDAYSITLPGGRKNIVLSKYIGTLIIILISSIITVGLIFVIKNLGVQIDMDGFLEQELGMLFAIILIMSFAYPFIYKFGVEKSRIGLMVVSFGIAGLATLALQKISIPTELINILDKYGFIVFTLGSLLSVIISYLISKNIYSKKEF